MFPYHDENQTQRPTYVTFVIIALNVLAWLTIQGAGTPLALARSVCELGLIPGELTGLAAPGGGFPMGEGLVCLTDPGRQVSHVLTSMFLHGSWMHLLGNMWFLWIFGNNIEDSMGHGRFVAFYLLSGVAAALLQVVFNPASVIPMVGASGAISGVMGGYLILYPRVRVYTMVPLGFFITSVALPAWTMLLYWAALQMLGGLTGLFAEERGGVAFWAHIGGFVAGVILIKRFGAFDPLDIAGRKVHSAAIADPTRLRGGCSNVRLPRHRDAPSRGAVRLRRSAVWAAPRRSPPAFSFVIPESPRQTALPGSAR